MDAQLKEIIDTIQSEGVQAAEKQAARIVSEAEERAAQIINDAEKRASDIVRSAQSDAERAERTGKENLAQAGRDLVLNVETRLKRLFQRVVEQTTRQAYTPEVLQNAIVALVQSGTESADLAVQIGAQSAADVEKALYAKLGQSLKEGVTITPVDGIDAGFRISEKDGNAYYDFTASGIAELLGVYLNPRLAEILRDAAKD
jgi:V/A-type H+/Na+-transporting ATPase subunit E